jgi:hypothetical protein
MSEAGAPAAGGLGAPGVVEPAPGPSRGRRWVIPAAIVVVVLVVVAALIATGTLRFGTASSSPLSDETFSQAESTAQSGANADSGGTWYPVLGVAVSLPAASLEPIGNLSGLLGAINCTFAWPHGEPANIAIPATSTSASVGAAAYWTFGFKNASNGLLIESVADGVASTLAFASGGECASIVAFLTAFPAGVVDSPAVVSAVNEVGGSDFLATHPNSTRVWGAEGGASYDGLGLSPEWFVAYTSCTLPLSEGENGALFNATVGGTSGVVTGHSNETVSCLPTIPTLPPVPPLLGPLLGAAHLPSGSRKAI